MFVRTFSFYFLPAYTITQQQLVFVYVTSAPVLHYLQAVLFLPFRVGKGIWYRPLISNQSVMSQQNFETLNSIEVLEESREI